MVVRFPSAAEIVKTLESDAKLGAQFKDQKLLQKIGNTFAFKDSMLLTTFFAIPSLLTTRSGLSTGTGASGLNLSISP